MRIVFWLEQLSFHQSAPIRALAARDIDVTWVAPEALSQARKAQGWCVPDTGKANVVLAPDANTIERLVTEAPEASVHIFKDIHYCPINKQGLYRCLQTSARLGLLLESRNYWGGGPIYDGGWRYGLDRSLRGIMRLLRYRRDAAQFKDRIGFFLIMGYGGTPGRPNFYEMCGFPVSRMYPYGHFTEKPAMPPEVAVETGGPVRLACLGNCIATKGVDLLLRALQPLTNLDWALTVIGNGPFREGWIALTRQLGLAERVTFLPAMPQPLALQEVASSDIYIQPSRFDGWGAVINEALMRGVPVVCSSRCGAADLLTQPWRGEVFPAYSVSALQDALCRWIGRGKRTPALSQRIRSWSRCIEGDAAATYLLAVLESAFGGAARPVAPWLQA